MKAEISDFEKQRQENIARNRELLKQLNLDQLTRDVYSDVKSESPRPKKRKVVKPKEKEPIIATRRSRRIAGIKMEDTEEGRIAIEEAEEARRKLEELEKLKQVRLNGDIKLLDILSDKNGVKLEDDAAILSKFRELGKSFSMGDFYETIAKKDSSDDKEIQKVRKEFDNLDIFPEFDPLDVKMTPQRMTTIAFHPSSTKRLAIGGDTVGHMGIWSIDDKKENGDDDEPEPEISILKNHGKAISKIIVSINEPTNILTASYDGSIRNIDLTTLKSTPIFTYDDEYGHAIGISDINIPMSNSNLLYFTTLNGEFASLDMRDPNKKLNPLRVHDKKIGSFSVNPKQEHQIATASLDRSLRLWDLRNVSKSKWSEIGGKSPHCYGSYHSRLSVSCSDWNSSGHIVCNGYDDTINIFNVNDSSSWSQTHQPKSEVEPEVENIPINFTPSQKIKHNCQTGRWVSILKSKWQINPKDGIEKFAIANMNRSVDVFTQEGVQVAHLRGPLVGAVPAVVAFHPTENWVVGGSASGKGYLFV